MISLMLITPPSRAADSICRGTVANGSLENGVALPEKGENFEAYGEMGSRLGRIYVHSSVAAIVADAYQTLLKTQPGTTFVYGESSLAQGGRMRPHRTHRNGTSVDFMVPVRDAAGVPTTIPRTITNEFGYDLEFNALGRRPGMRIDFEAITRHLRALHEAAQSRGLGIRQVIFERDYLPFLYATSEGEWVRNNIAFRRQKTRGRHDEHYHIDFAIPCETR